jgi:hypothetical protein
VLSLHVCHPLRRRNAQPAGLRLCLSLPHSALALSPTRLLLLALLPLRPQMRCPLLFPLLGLPLLCFFPLLALSVDGTIAESVVLLFGFVRTIAKSALFLWRTITEPIFIFVLRLFLLHPLALSRLFDELGFPFLETLIVGLERVQGIELWPATSDLLLTGGRHSGWELSRPRRGRDKVGLVCILVVPFLIAEQLRTERRLCWQWRL